MKSFVLQDKAADFASQENLRPSICQDGHNLASYMLTSKLESFGDIDLSIGYGSGGARCSLDMRVTCSDPVRVGV